MAFLEPLLTASEAMAAGEAAGAGAAAAGGEAAGAAEAGESAASKGLNPAQFSDGGGEHKDSSGPINTDALLTGGVTAQEL